MSVAEIKERAIQQAQRASRGASAISLIRSAKGQISLAQSCESAGDLKGALSAFTKAASLTQVFMDTADFKAESVPGKRGVLWKEFTEFQQREGSDLMQRAHAIESRLSQVERSATTQLNGHHHHPSPPLENGVQKVSGGSIADRMRSLQDAGLSVSTTKRVSREIPSTLSIPLSPTSTSSDSARTIRNSLQSVGLSSPTISHSTSPSSKVSSPSPSAHSFVSPSAFGPPSPTSSASSSPRTSFLTPVEFSQAFPSIDELEEIDGQRTIANVEPRSDSSGSSDSKPTPWSGSSHPPGDRSPNVGNKSFPVLPVDLGTRPSSTPITPVVDHFASRPASPAKRALGIRGSGSPLMPSTELHVKNHAEPRELHSYMYRNELKVLMLDVRTREMFDNEHIRGDAVVCIEPSVLLRDSVSGQTIEDSLAVAPRDEWVLFCNRDKFDLIAIYDDASEIPGPPDAPLSRLVRAIYETAFRKILKRVPVLLIGGFEAWKREFGERELVVAEAPVLSVPTPLPPALPPTEVFVPPSPQLQLPQPQLPHAPRSPSGASVTTPTLEAFRALPPVPRNPQPVSDIRPPLPLPDNYPHRSFDQGPASPRLTEPRDFPSEPARRLQRKPTMTRPPSVSSLNALPRTMSEGAPQVSPTIPQANTNGPIQYPQIARTLVPHNSGSPFNGSAGSYGLASPPQASLHPSSLSRRRSEYHNQSQESLTLTGAGFASRAPIDYPDLSAQHILRPPPAAASPKERPRTHAHSFSTGPPPPTIPSEYPVTYWPDVQIGISGLKNLGNTCYMNSTIQCLSATVPFARFFTDGRWKSAVNMVNPLGTKGNLVHAFSGILHDMWHGEMPYITPFQFRRSICLHASQFGGSEQHDSQEFLSFLLDGLHEDLNRILNKPTNEVTIAREEELEKLPQQIASEQEWKIYRMRNDSLVVDFFQGQFRNRLECLTCHKTSTTYNTFMYLSLPIPSTKTSKFDIQQCLDAFVRTEVMEKSDAWNCPRCKTLRKATKTLSLSRLPPVLLIHFKRFSFKGPFTDKIEKHIDFPLKGLDLTNYMPPPLPPGVDRTGMQMYQPDDPRSQIPPYKYDLYAVTNHFGSLSSGHYTSFIASRGGWLYCDDSRVTPANAKEVVGKPAYVLYYKRVKA